MIGSSLPVTWNSEVVKNGDWIGLYNLNQINVFITTSSPIRKFSLDSIMEKEKVLSAFLHPNSQAGQFIFIYFSQFKPVGICDIIEVQQPSVTCPLNKQTSSKIKHLVIICTENHSFDMLFGNYCKSPTYSNPSCTTGPECCEKAPDFVDNHRPVLQTEAQNLMYDPNHNQFCELCEINNGKMDGYIKGCKCSNPSNFAIVQKELVKIVHEYAENYSLADRFFHSNAGASAQNNMYIARSSHVFIDNRKTPIGSIGSNCQYRVRFLLDEFEIYYDPIITDLLSNCGFNLKTYAEGYDIAAENFDDNPCYPHGYDSSDIPFNYYAGKLDCPDHMKDYKKLKNDIKNNTLPDVSFIKPLGTRTGHPNAGTLTDEMNFVEETVDMILNSDYNEDTLIVYYPDESGGYYDHVPTPPNNQIDDTPYGPRIPFLAIGKFAKKNYVSHVQMEQSSIIKFIEWNWLNGETGHLNVRDMNVNSIGDLIDPEKAGIIVP